MPDDAAGWRGSADAWARTVLRVLGTAHPYAAGHVSAGPDDLTVDPRRLHPAFWGSFDWHSSVHMQWSAVRLLTLAPEHLADATRRDLVELLDERLTPAALGVEAAYLRDHPSWERPYGWAWTVALAAAVAGCPRPEAERWSAGLAPLSTVVAEHLLGWLPRLDHPVRHGVHANTAFALALLHEAYGALGRADVVAAVAEAGRRWFVGDRDYPAAWEPSGSDFLSPALCEADLVRRLLPSAAFGPWLAAFLPGLGGPDDPLLAVPEVRDPTDGQSVHLVGLALSRAWQLRLLTPHLPAGVQPQVASAAAQQEAAATAQIVAGDFMATHWLVSFALLAATAATDGMITS
ncbi:Protein of unknown function [Friedmanniella luteola]|uniref:DUF2891 domain-containing protein n=1 Tax=Friedmanniella luteola TaxID=546871 RepID=A0A1H1ZIL5_9ACTN|nr:DUF2891 family protein [Friedmanniella luteola]SDT33631.1 Protein of unknown function [Friedmanniella luteola]